MMSVYKDLPDSSIQLRAAEDADGTPRGLPDTAVRQITYQVLKAVEFCHANNVSWCQR